MPCSPERLLLLPVRWRGLISLKGRWNIARVLCAYAASAGDSQLPAAKQQEELFSTWPSHGLAKRCLLLPNLGCVWTGVSRALSASLSFLSGMAWPTAGRGDPVQCCCLPTPDHPAPQQRAPPDAAAAEDQRPAKGDRVSPAHAGQCQLLPQHVSLLHQSCFHVSVFSRCQGPDMEQPPDQEDWLLPGAGSQQAKGQS